MKSPLLVIDVQTYFVEDIPPLEYYRFVRETLVVIKRAVREKREILLVVYQGHGPVIPEIKRVLANYPHTVITKNEDDGAGAVRAIIQRKQIRGFTAIGLNLHYCVKETTVTLARHGYRCRVLLRATIDAWEGYVPVPKPTKRSWGTVRLI